jgi:TonB family protein
MRQTLSEHIYPFFAVSLLIHALALGTFQLQKMHPELFMRGKSDQRRVLSMSIKKVTLPTTAVEKKQVKTPKKTVAVPRQMKETKSVSKVSQPAQTVGSKSNNQQVINEYTLQLKSYLEKNKVYPRLAAKLRQSGVVKIKLEIAADGKFGDIQILAPSRFQSLNKGTMHFLKKTRKV